MSHDLKPEQRAELVNRQLEQLRAERFMHQMNVARWEAIPEGLRDGSEAEGIEAAEHAIGVLEAQMDALAGLMPRPVSRQDRRGQARAAAKRDGA